MAEVNFLVKKGLTVPKGSASTPAIIFDASDPNTGIYSPAADQLAISTNGTGRLFVDANGLIGVGGAPSIYSLDVTGNGIRTRESANSSSLVLGTFDAGGYTYITSDKIGTGSYQPFAFFTGGFERMRLDSSGRLGLGTSSPGSIFEAKGNSPQLIVNSTTASYPGLVFQTNGVSDGGILYNGSGDKLEFYTGDTSGNPEVVIDALGRVGIGVNAPDPGGQGLHVHNASAADSSVRITNSTTGATNGDGFAIQVASDGTARLRQFENVALTFETNATERGRWDSSGRFLVGTSTARTNFFNSSVSAISQVEEVGGGSAAYSAITNVAGATGPAFVLGKTRGTSAGSNTVVNSGDQLGTLSFQGSDGSEFVEGAIIRAEVDGTPGANDMPCRLVFSVTADGASSPTEAMRIKNSRIINIANTPTYADNAAAKAGGLVDGDVYRTSTGVLMIVYT